MARLMSLLSVSLSLTRGASEAIEIIWEKKQTYTTGEIVERAGRVVEWAVQNGTTVLRSHVDVDTLGGLYEQLGGLLDEKTVEQALVELVETTPDELLVELTVLASGRKP